MYFTPRRYAYRRPAAQPLAGPERCAFLVVGAGPVGLTLALALARLGERCILLEQNDSVGGGSRALGMSRRTLEIWDALGAGRAIAEGGLPWTSGRTFYRGRTVLEFEMPQDASLKHPPMVNIQQSVADQNLVDALEKEVAADVRWLSRLAAIERIGERMLASIDTPEGRYAIDADIVVACDGPRSAVRQALGARMAGATFEARYLIVDVSLKSGCPPGRRAWFDPPSNPGSTVIMHRQPDDLWRIDSQLRDDEDLDAALSAKAVRERVQRHLDYIGEHGEWRVEWTSWYKAHSRALPRFRHGPVFFAGDAAHLIPIFGIRGLNSGVEDAWTLAWRLALFRRGEAGEDLLDAWSAERVSAARENIAQANRSTCIMTPPTDGLRLMRDAVLSLALTQSSVRGILNPRQGTPASARSSPLNSHAHRSADFTTGPQPGDILPNVEVRASGRAARLHDLLDPRRFNAVLFSDATVRADVHRVILEDEEDRRRFGADASSCYLIRPDHLVCARWKRSDAQELAAAVAHACGRAGVH